MARRFAVPRLPLSWVVPRGCDRRLEFACRLAAGAAASRLAVRQPRNRVAAGSMGRNPDRDYRLSALEPGHLVVDLCTCHDSGRTSRWTTRAMEDTPGTLT